MKSFDSGRGFATLLAKLLVAVLLAGGMALAEPLPARATSGWSLAAAPNPSGSTQTWLMGVSCATSRSCMAVGYYVPSGDDRSKAAIERWNGKSWALLASPTPAGSTDHVLYGVTCTAPDRCVAVGFSRTPANRYLPLVERWDGASWHIEAAPDPAGGDGQTQLEGVSCPSATSCTAVGYSADSVGNVTALVEQWNGSSWSIAPVGSRAGSNYGDLHGVACHSTSNCKAVGQYHSSSNRYRTLVQRWNGANWAIAPSVDPAGSSFAQLNSVACTASARCLAAGAVHFASGGFQPLAELWDGTRWSASSPPSPAGSDHAALFGASCPASGCVAVGRSITGAVGHTFAARLPGSTWETMQPIDPAGSPDSILHAVSCPTSTLCVAVGTYLSPAGDYRPLIEHYTP